SNLRRLEAQHASTRYQLGRRLEQPSHARNGVVLLESRLFNCCANEQSAIGPRNEITARTPRHAPEHRGFSHQVQQLTSYGPDRRSFGTFDVDLARPAPGGKHDLPRRKRTLLGLDDEIVCRSADSMNATPLDNVRPIS